MKKVINVLDVRCHLRDETQNEDKENDCCVYFVQGMIRTN